MSRAAAALPRAAGAQSWHGGQAQQHQQGPQTWQQEQQGSWQQGQQWPWSRSERGARASQGASHSWQDAQQQHHQEQQQHFQHELANALKLQLETAQALQHQQHQWQHHILDELYQWHQQINKEIFATCKGVHQLLLLHESDIAEHREQRMVSSARSALPSQPLQLQPQALQRQRDAPPNVAQQPPSAAATAHEPPYQVLQAVEAQWRNEFGEWAKSKAWWPAVVRGVNDNGTYEIEFDNGFGHQNCVPADRIRQPKVQLVPSPLAPPTVAPPTASSEWTDGTDDGQIATPSALPATTVPASALWV